MEYNLINSIAESAKNGKTAMINNGNIISYKELKDKIDRACLYMKEETGIKERSLVLLVTPRCVEQIELMLTFFSLNIAYCNIDFNEKKTRIGHIISNSRPQYIITTAEKAKEFDLENYFVCGRYDALNIYCCKEESPLFDEDVSYVLYTSGTTGVPKGVVIGKEAAYNFIFSIKEIMISEDNGKIMLNTAFNFDISFLESIASFYYGLTVVFMDMHLQNNPKKIASFIDEYSIDIVQMTPSLLTNIYIYFRGNCAIFNKVKRLLVGGEKFPENMYENLKKISDLSIYNMYGPAEATVWATFKKLDDGEINIGKALPGYNVFVVNDENVIVKNEIGEICISGKSVAIGYLNDKEMTESHFCKDISGYSPKMYRTGDLGIQHDNGEISYIGRKDTQVKFRGYRIELGEIETAVKNYRLVEDAVVIMKTDKKTNLKTLICFYMSNTEIDIKDINLFLSKMIPQYMIPQKYVRLDKFPLKLNGKIDRNSLMNI